MATNKVPTLDGSGKVRDKHLPQRLDPATLNASFVTTDPALLALRRDLDNGRTTAFGVFSDSTGDADGSVAVNDRWVSRLARDLGTIYPSHHILLKKWDDGTAQAYGPWVAIQSQAAGRRYVALAGRSLRWEPANKETTRFSGPAFDISVLVDPGKWAPGTGGERTLVSRITGPDASYGTAFQFRWRLDNTGKMLLNWSTDGAGYEPTRTSTAAISAPDNTALWVRVTATMNISTGYDVRYYTSPANDGVTWTQLGAAVSYSGALQGVLKDTADSMFEIGAEGWQPAATTMTGKFYEVKIRNGIDGPTMTSCNLSDWRRYGDPSTTVGGAPTLYVINGAASSRNLAYLSDPVRMPKLTPDYGQRVQFYSTSHNDTDLTGPRYWQVPYKAWVDASLARLPKASPVAVGQSPHTSAWPNEATWGESHKTRIAELSALAAKNGWGYLDAYNAFLKSASPLTDLISSDGLHPVLAGYQVWADAATRMVGRVRP